MTLEELVTTRNKYQRKLEDKDAYRELCETVGKNNATANREWLRKKVKDLDKKSLNYLDCKGCNSLYSYMPQKINKKESLSFLYSRISIQYQS